MRQYKEEDVEKVRLVYHLVKEKGMTIAGAKQRLKQNKEFVQNNAEIAQRLKLIKEELIIIKKELDYLT